MQILKIEDKNSIKIACEEISAGNLVIYPTETCYGIAVDATNKEAVTKLLDYKGDRYRQVAVAVSDKEMASKYVSLNEIAGNLYKNFLPGPITVISESLHVLDTRLESESGGLGVRIPKYDFALELIKSFGKPITATSANTSGKKEPYSLEDWQKYTVQNKQEMVTLFLDGGKLLNRPTSTVVDTTLNDPMVLRQGALTIPSLSKTINTTSVETTISFASDLMRKHMNLLARFPLILALEGDLGVGKTQFVKGIAVALGIDLNISSPTYTLMKEYEYGTPAGPGLAGPNDQPARPGPNGQSKYSGVLYHIDTWRLPDSSDLETSLHLSNLLKSGNIVAIEWAGKASELLKSYEKEIPILIINIKEIDVNTRQITYAFSTPEWS